MTTARRIFTDPALYLLILFNTYFIYEYGLHPDSYAGTIWIFWCQSVLIGIFNFLELLTTKNVQPDDFQMNGQPADPEKGRSCYAFFFLVHFGSFHFVYLIFLAVQVGFKNIDPTTFGFSLLLLFVSQTFAFFRHRQAYKQAPPNLGFLFFAPYLRVVPMHLMILGPALFHLPRGVIFLVLKTLMDVAGYLITLRLQDNKAEPPVLA